MVSVNKETIWHFSCKECKGWWSIANTDDWKPKKLFCTHCGKPYVSDTKRTHKKITKEDSVKEKYGRAVMTASEQMQEKLEPLPDLAEEAEDEILKSTGKIDSNDEKAMECIYKKELGFDFETMNDGVAVGEVRKVRRRVKL